MKMLVRKESIRSSPPILLSQQKLSTRKSNDEPYSIHMISDGNLAINLMDLMDLMDPMDQVTDQATDRLLSQVIGLTVLTTRKVMVLVVHLNLFSLVTRKVREQKEKDTTLINEMPFSIINPKLRKLL
jgi:hypothetical protein